MSSQGNIYYFPIHDPNVLLEGCQTLLKILIEKIIERHLNGFSNYADESLIKRVRVTKIEIGFNNSYIVIH